jgi:hypothetical protein
MYFTSSLFYDLCPVACTIKNIMKIVSDIRKCSLHYKWAISLAFPNCGVTYDHHLQSSSVYKTHFGEFSFETNTLNYFIQNLVSSFFLFFNTSIRFFYDILCVGVCLQIIVLKCEYCLGGEVNRYSTILV